MAGGSLLEQMLETAMKNGGLRGGAGQGGGAAPGGGLGDILGQVLGGGQAGGGRTQQGGGGLGDILGQVLGGGQAGGARAQPGGGGLGDILGQVLGGGGAAGGAGGGLGDILGQVLGGGQPGAPMPAGRGAGGGTLGDSFREKDVRVDGGGRRVDDDDDDDRRQRRGQAQPTTAAPQGSGKGGIEIPANLQRYGGLAILGVLAWKVLQSYQQKTGAPADTSTSGFNPGNAPGGADGLQRTLVDAMIGAMQSDGVVDQAEQKQLLGELDKLGVDNSERQDLAKRLGTPVDIASIVKAATTPELAVQVYAASVLAIAVDTPEERQYLDRLAEALGMDAGLKQQVEQTLGKA
jgi:uncharacterized membrane protein YebE (DUF533 family)